eukprot:NODE_3981_length_884_cov_21.968862_g3669_i0.p1 GENE.NODE_3981_length_884_cov_21.968862_g3669_i0~~NODE_3981_length_884_cov_21.968862_g3669_i0.p1  ORF type:complete len:223 (+),score=26.36 NODE_3981_length_884_cov_21.968862_g3669_i0:133-801(+)
MDRSYQNWQRQQQLNSTGGGGGASSAGARLYLKHSLVRSQEAGSAYPPATQLYPEIERVNPTWIPPHSEPHLAAIPESPFSKRSGFLFRKPQVENQQEEPSGTITYNPRNPNMWYVSTSPRTKRAYSTTNTSLRHSGKSFDVTAGRTSGQVLSETASPNWIPRHTQERDPPSIYAHAPKMVLQPMMPRNEPGTVTIGGHDGTRWYVDTRPRVTPSIRLLVNQ